MNALLSERLIDTVVFDLGGVLIDWNPRYIYRDLFNDESKMEHFLKEIVSHDWNAKLDEGVSFSDNVAELTAKHPDHADMIKVYQTHWHKMLKDAIPGTVEILKELKGHYRLLGLSNWSAETFPVARARFEFLKDFETILVSGEEKLIKPDPKFYQLLQTRHQVNPVRAVFIDDVEKNIHAASALGFQTILFKNPDQLRQDLIAKGVSLQLKTQT